MGNLFNNRVSRPREFNAIPKELFIHLDNDMINFVACPLLSSPIKNPSIFVIASQQNSKSLSSGGEV